MTLPPPRISPAGAAFVTYLAQERRREEENRRKEEIERKKQEHLRSFFDASMKGNKSLLSKELGCVDVNASDYKYIGNPTALYHAALEGHDDVVKILLQSGAKCNWGKDDNETPLWIAARNGHKSTLEILIKSGASINTCNAEGLTPLAAAARYDHFNCACFLIRAGANLNIHDNEGHTALDQAIIQGRENIVSLFLLEKKNVVCIGNKYGNEPLHTAVIHKQTKIIKLLIEVGKARIESKNKEGKNAMDLAIESNDLEIVDILLSLRPSILTAEGLNRKTPLECASFCGHLEIVKKLLEKGAKQIFDSLQWACIKGHVEIIKHLLFIDPKMVNNIDYFGRRILCLAVENNQIEAITFLLNQGADPNLLAVPGYATDRTQRFTPLHLAKSSSVVELLIKKGADVNKFDSAGKTPVAVAAKNNNCEVIKKLCEYGAYINYSQWPEGKKTFSSSPLEEAVKNYNLEAIRTLVECGANVKERDKQNNPLVRSVIDTLCLETEEVKTRNPNLFEDARANRSKLYEVATLLFELGVSANDVDYQGCPLLLRAAFDCPVEVLRFLHKWGADINISNDVGQTALHFVIDDKNVELLDFLLANKAKIDVQSNKGETPLHLAATKGHIACFEKLIKKGASVQIFDKDGLSAFYHACLEGQLQIVDFLIHNCTKALKEQIRHYQTKEKKRVPKAAINENLKKSAVAIIREHIKIYMNICKSRWVVKTHSSRASLITNLDQKLCELIRDSSFTLIDVLKAIKEVQDFIKDKRAHGLKGYKKSKLYLELEKATNRIKQACDVISSIIEHY